MTTNARGRKIMRATAGNRFCIRTPHEITCSPRGREGSSNPDITLMNCQQRPIRVLDEGRWAAVSDHKPVRCTVEPRTDEKRGTTRRRIVSKMAVDNVMKLREVAKA